MYPMLKLLMALALPHTRSAQPLQSMASLCTGLPLQGIYTFDGHLSISVS